MFAGGCDARGLEELADASGGASDEAGGVFLAEFAEINGAEAVDVFIGGDAVEDFSF